MINIFLVILMYLLQFFLIKQINKHLLQLELYAIAILSIMPLLSVFLVSKKWYEKTLSNIFIKTILGLIIYIGLF